MSWVGEYAVTSANTTLVDFSHGKFVVLLYILVVYEL